MKKNVKFWIGLFVLVIVFSSISSYVTYSFVSSRADKKLNAIVKLYDDRIEEIRKDKKNKETVKQNLIKMYNGQLDKLGKTAESLVEAQKNCLMREQKLKDLHFKLAQNSDGSKKDQEALELVKTERANNNRDILAFQKEMSEVCEKREKLKEKIRKIEILGQEF